MRRAPLLILLAGCSVPSNPPATEPATSGGTLYVIDTTLDCFDELDFNSTLALPAAPTRVQWIGEQAFRILLRMADRKRGARLLGSAGSELENGRPARFQVAWPLDYLAPVAGGLFDVRRSNHSASLSMESAPVLSNDEKHVTLKLTLRRVLPYRNPLAGTDLDVGEPLGVFEDLVDVGSHTIPVGGVLAVSIRGDSDRLLLVLLHAASVRAP